MPRKFLSDKKLLKARFSASLKTSIFFDNDLKAQVVVGHGKVASNAIARL